MTFKKLYNKLREYHKNVKLDTQLILAKIHIYVLASYVFKIPVCLYL